MHLMIKQLDRRKHGGKELDTEAEASVSVTKEEMLVAVSSAIINLADPSFKQVQSHVLNDLQSRDSGIIATLRNVYVQQLKIVAKQEAKKLIGQMMEKDAANFIKCYSAKAADELATCFPSSSFASTRLRLLKQENCVGSTFNELRSFIIRLKRRFISIEAEAAFRESLLEFLSSGTVDLKTWKQMRQWHNSHSTLTDFRKIAWVSKSSAIDKLQIAAARIPSNKFYEQHKVCQLASIFFENEKQQLEDDGRIIRVIGRTLFLSEQLAWLERILAVGKCCSVIVMAADAVGIDASLDKECWRGVNVSIVTNKIHVWNNSLIDLSGKSFLPGQKTASRSFCEKIDGSDGKHGSAGLSAGNLMILTKEMINGQRLQVKLNGGRGEDGENGGSGFDGKDGAGITVEELNKLNFSYSSLYFESWSAFFKQEPLNSSERKSYNFWQNSSSQFLYREYVDQSDRKIIYSLAGDVGLIYTTYDLLLVVKGAVGTAGTSGGRAGLGGEGGFAGDCVIESPETGSKWKIGAVENKKGENGADGKPGSCGRMGRNGNDMAFLDRSSTGRSKWYYGSQGEKKLSLEYAYKAETKYHRFHGYRKHIEKRNDCFAKVVEGTLDRSERFAEKKVEQILVGRKKANASAALLSSDLLSEFDETFEKDSCFIADACTARKEQEMTEETLEEQEEEQQVSEQVTILSQRDNKQTLHNTKRAKKPEPHFPNGQAFVDYVLEQEKNTAVKCVQMCFDLFEFELTPKQLKSLKLLPVIFQMRLKRYLDDRFITALLTYKLQERIASLEDFTKFVYEFEQRRRRKQAMAKLRQKLAGVCKHFGSVTRLKTGGAINVKEDTLFGVQKEELPNDDGNRQSAIINEFFALYRENSVSDVNLLHILHNFLNEVKADVDSENTIKEILTGTPRIRWIDEETLKSLTEVLAKKAQDREESGSETKSRHKKSILADLDPVVRFDKMVKSKGSDWEKRLCPLKNWLDKDKEHIARFKKVPTFNKRSVLQNAYASVAYEREAPDTSEEDSNTNEEHVRCILRVFLMANELLRYNRHLYNIHYLYESETSENWKQIMNFIDDGASNSYSEFIRRYEAEPVDCSSGRCQDTMRNKGLESPAYRYLYAHTERTHVVGFGMLQFQTLYRAEEYGKDFTMNLPLWLEKGKVWRVAEDSDFRDLVNAQEIAVERVKDELESLLDNCSNYDSIDSIMKRISIFFKPTEKENVQEWIEGYVATTGSEGVAILRLLITNLELDGSHLEGVELQFILSSCAFLLRLRACPVQMLLVLLAGSFQQEFLTILIFMRITYRLGRRCADHEKIMLTLKAVKSRTNKALFVTKMDAYDGKLDEKDVMKLLLMLQHAGRDSEHLARMGFEEWIGVASQQKWSEIETILAEYGPVGYYLGVLDNRGHKQAEFKIRSLLSKNLRYPEKLLALITSYIVSSSVDENDRYFDALKTLFTSFILWKRKSGRPAYELVTNENEQLKMFSKAEVSDELWKRVLPNREITLDDLSSHVIGLHDLHPADKTRRRTQIQRLVSMLKDKECRNSNVKYLQQFDRVLAKVKSGKRLRSTQKLAILIALEGDGHVLEQVSTGEGKSFIIAGIAAIRLLSGSAKFIDIVTSSPTLAQRDADAMRPLYSALGLTVGSNCYERLEQRQRAYQAQIVYGDMAHFQRDHLLHTFYRKNILGIRTRDIVIVDEVDNMMLDNGNNMLYLSHNIPSLRLLDSLFIFIHRQVQASKSSKGSSREDDDRFNNSSIRNLVLGEIFGQITMLDVKQLAPHLSETEVEEAFEVLIREEIIDPQGFLIIQNSAKFERVVHSLDQINDILRLRLQDCIRIMLKRERQIDIPIHLHTFVKQHLEELIQNCVQAWAMEADAEYVVDLNRTGIGCDLEPVVTIIDSNTGADLSTSQWSGGLQQYIQIKHGCRITPLGLKAVFVSNVAYLKGYSRINGLSGTLGSTDESKTLIELYGADLVKIPTNKPKVMYEHVPVLAMSTDVWLQNIYDKIKDQALASRAVLVICDSIGQVVEVEKGLWKIWEGDTTVCAVMNSCMKNIVAYKRQHDEFNFEGDRSLEAGRVILATNLAGRGTDIQLSDELLRAGGLHVIVAFVPRNTRIEEQAYGRAARAGQPGSAQIVALVNPEDGVMPTVFQLKTFRDNAEIQRLQSLKRFYEFHTQIEEACLEKFRQHCDQQIFQTFTAVTASITMPVAKTVIYGAILDEWALWLDEQTPAIEQCAKTGRTQEKESIINSINGFLQKHVVLQDRRGICFPTWIRSSESRLNIAIIQMCHDGGFSAAEKTLQKLMTEGCNDFSAAAAYYMACMRMRKFSKMRKPLRSLSISEEGKEFPEDVKMATRLFIQSRALYSGVLARKQADARLVLQIVETSTHVKSNGFMAQHKEITQAYGTILSNIDWLIGGPIDKEDFHVEGIKEEDADFVHEALKKLSVISPSLLMNEVSTHVGEWQSMALRNKFNVSRTQVTETLRTLESNPNIGTFSGQKSFGYVELIKSSSIPNRIQFWHHMIDIGAFYDVQQVYVVNSGAEEQVKEVLGHAIEPIPKMTMEQLQYAIRYNNTSLDGVTMYRSNDLTEDHLFKVRQMLKLEQIAKVNVLLFTGLPYCPEFDGITAAEFSDFFDVDNGTTEWILEILLLKDVLTKQTASFLRVANDWEKKITKSQPKHTKSSLSFLQYEQPLTLTVELLKEVYTLIEDSAESKKTLNDGKPSKQEMKVDYEKLFNELKQLSIFESYNYTVFRLSGKLDCSELPTAIADEVHRFLADRFSYTFALESLAQCLDDSKQFPHTVKQVFLHENPHQEMLEEMKRLGLMSPPRICTEHYKLVDYDDFPNVNKTTLEGIIHSRRFKLNDDTFKHMRFAPFADFIHQQTPLVSGELRALMERGFPVSITRRELSTAHRITGRVLNEIGSCVRRISCFFKGISQGVGWMIGSISHYAGKFGRAVSGFLGPLVPQIIKKCTYKMASATVDGVEWVEKKVGELVDWTNNKIETGITKASRWVGERLEGTWVERAGDSVADFAKRTAANLAQCVSSIYNYCKSSAGSYQYYNECRVAAQRLSANQQTMEDCNEYQILRMYNGISEAAKEQQEMEDANEKEAKTSLLEYSDGLSVALRDALKKLLCEMLSKLDIKVYSDVLMKVINEGEVIRKLEAELTSHFALFAVYFLWCFHSHTNVRLKITPLTGGELLNLKDLFSSLGEELMYAMRDMTVTIVPKEQVHEAIDQFVQRIVKTVLIDPVWESVSAVLSTRDCKISMTSLHREALADGDEHKFEAAESPERQYLQKGVFLPDEMRRTMHELLSIDGPHRLQLLALSVRYGYPIPASCTQVVSEALRRVVQKSKLCKAGIALQLLDENDFPLTPKLANVKIHLRIRPIAGFIYACQVDYERAVSMKRHQLPNDSSAFIYELLLSKRTAAFAKKIFPRRENSFRELISKELLNV